MKKIKLLFLIFFLLLTTNGWCANYPITFSDSVGKEISLKKQPTRVVSLVPSVTEMLMRLGAEESVLGITHHSALLPEASDKEVVGGFFSPDLDRVTALNPQVIFYSDLQKEVPERFRGKAVLIQLSASSIAEGFEHINLLGRIFDREDEAAEIISEQKRQLKVIAEKVADIPEKKRQRVVRLMGRESLMTPGDDSFQNEYIRSAGGIAPAFGRDGNIISVSLEEWQQFNPQVIYGCGDRNQSLPILAEPGWRDVEAVRNGRILFFPCKLTCRAATQQGYFVSWLAARVYNDQFGNEENFILPEEIVESKPVEPVIDLDYVKDARIITSNIKDFHNKTVALTLKEPMKVVSTLGGQRSGITTVANHYFPPPSWGLAHKGLDSLRKSAFQVLDFDADSTAMLFTGANMDNLAVVKKTYRDMEVTALVTAGVMGNAMRMAMDTGNYYEPGDKKRHEKPGTINILLMSNMKLSPRAMTRALISATEAKSAALQDLDIRSTYSTLVNQATGTGTDNIIVVEGAGQPIGASGGHTKMGELMAKAVHEGVQKAVYKQNGVVAKRSVFQRLRERRIDLYSLSEKYASEAGTVCRKASCAPPPPKSLAADLNRRVEKLLLEPQYAGFLKAIMAISDQYERGLVKDTKGVDLWCQTIASEIAGKKVNSHRVDDENLPEVIAKGLGALLSGTLEKIEN